MTSKDYMRRAIELAKKGEGAVNPNPLVGAVIVKDGRVIGEGYHMAYGQLHAERQAFVNATEDTSGAEMYVTLEPCCHHGKQPPCTEAIIEHKIRKVYVGSDDPNELVAGKGIKQLRDAGIEVETGFLKEECDALNPVFFHYITSKTPYVVMKYAVTMDGKIATRTGDSKWITNEASRNHSQRLRNRMSGIMVGIGTVLADNPMLTCRLEGGRNPVRIVCDSHLRIPMESNLVKTAKEVPTYVVCLPNEEKDKQEALKLAGVNVVEISPKDGKIDLNNLMEYLGANAIDSVMIEGGGTLNSSALEAGIVQEVQMYMAPKIFGGQDAKSVVGGTGVALASEAYQFVYQGMEENEGDLCLYFEKKRK